MGVNIFNLYYKYIIFVVHLKFVYNYPINPPGYLVFMLYNICETTFDLH